MKLHPYHLFLLQLPAQALSLSLRIRRSALPALLKLCEAPSRKLISTCAVPDLCTGGQPSNTGVCLCSFLAVLISRNVSSMNGKCHEHIRCI